MYLHTNFKLVACYTQPLTVSRPLSGLLLYKLFSYKIEKFIIGRRVKTVIIEDFQQKFDHFSFDNYLTVHNFHFSFLLTLINFPMKLGRLK